MMDYKEKEKMEHDIQQCILNPNMSITKNPRKYAKQQIEKDFTLVVMCPFCLNTTELWRFSFTRGLRKCPNCLNEMRLETLIKIKSLIEFVKFVFNYRLEGFWNKVYPSFEEWNKKLYRLHISQEFWEEYKKLKGNSNENYEEGD